MLHLDLIEDISKFEIAKVSVEGGNAAFQCVKKVIELAMAGEVDATCTNALNKDQSWFFIIFSHKCIQCFFCLINVFNK